MSSDEELPSFITADEEEESGANDSGKEKAMVNWVGKELQTGFMQIS